MNDETEISNLDKSLPYQFVGMSTSAIAQDSMQVRDLWTPSLLLAKDRFEHNAQWMSDWITCSGLELMPHGKTTMSPQLWNLQLATGATGLTVATPWQLRMAYSFGIHRIQLANQLTDPCAIQWLGTINSSDANPQQPTIWSWIDDPRVVEYTEEILESLPQSSKLNVLVDLGYPGGRTGSRSIDDAIHVAQAVHDSDHLRLAGVAGYEGAIAADRSQESLRKINTYILDLLQLDHCIESFYDEGETLISAGGSAYPDLVANLFAADSRTRSSKRTTKYILRCGAYLIHDDGFYQRISPFDRQNRLIPAARGIARVISQPEEGLALLDCGKRDFPYDEGYPSPLYAIDQLTGKPCTISGSKISAMNDQHGFMRFDQSDKIEPGTVIVLGLSHPCTMFDKWRRIPVVERFSEICDGPLLDDKIIDFVDTAF